MFQLRGLGGEVDCAANPSDPVCSAFYNTAASTPATDWGMYTANVALFPPKATTTQNAGVNVATVPGTLPTATAIATSATGLWDSIPSWALWLGALGLAYVGYTQWYAPKKAG